MLFTQLVHHVGSTVDLPYCSYQEFLSIFLSYYHCNYVCISVPENFQSENFSGPVPTETLGTQDSEYIIGLGDRASILKL